MHDPGDEIEDLPLAEDQPAIVSELPQVTDVDEAEQENVGVPDGMLSMDTAPIRDICKAIYGVQIRMAQDTQRWLNGAEGALNNHNVRMQVVEAILTEPAMQSYRERMLSTDNPLTVQDLRDVAENFVQPKMIKQAEARAEALREAQEKMAEAARARETGLIGPDGRPIASNQNRRIIMEEN